MTMRGDMQRDYAAMARYAAVLAESLESGAPYTATVPEAVTNLTRALREHGTPDAYAAAERLESAMRARKGE